MPTFTVDWFSHNIPRWTQIFDSLGWLNSDITLRVLEVTKWGLPHKSWIDSHMIVRPLDRSDLGKASRHAGCCRTCVAAKTLHSYALIPGLGLSSMALLLRYALATHLLLYAC